MSKRQVIDRVNDPTEAMYFVDRGLVPIVTAMRDGRVVEVGAAGAEGVTDPNALFGLDRAVLETIVQMPGAAFPIKQTILVQQRQRSPAFLALMLGVQRTQVSTFAQKPANGGAHRIFHRAPDRHRPAGS